MMKTRHFTRSQREGMGRSRTPSTATADTGVLSEGDCSTTNDANINNKSNNTRTDSIDIDFSSETESGRTIAHLVNGMDDANDGLDFTIEHIIANQMQAEGSMAGGSVNTNNSNNNNRPSIVPAVTATVSNPLSIPKTAKAMANGIPQARPPQYNTRLRSNSTQPRSSRAGSHDSSGSDFLSGIMNPSAGVNVEGQLSHTPPSALGTSYENSHFGKRQRAGSVSGRLRSASDLEEKGVIDRQQKGILKDLIICGDEDLQQALDQYEKGNPSVLENMIRSGALQNKAVPDLDLLGDLDLDFLTVNDMGEDGDGNGMYALPPGARSRSNSKAVRPPTSAPLPNNSYGSKQHPVPSAHVSPEYDDGIGEMEFTGEFSDDENDGKNENEGEDYASNSESAPQKGFNNQPGYPGKQHRATSPIQDDKRLRSNSLFSALINDPRTVEQPSGHQYGQWMDNPLNPLDGLMQAADHVGLLDIPSENIDDLIAASTGTTAVSQPIPIPREDSDEMEDEPVSSTKKKGRRKSDSAIMDRKQKAKLKQEIAEQKRREKQEKRDQREREKLEKKEARLLAKEEKKKQKAQKKEAASMSVEEEDKPVHISGSGMPRSMSDPNFRSTRDSFGLVEIERPDGWVGAYSPESRKVRIDKFLSKRHKRVWTKTVKYDVRKNFADSRLRVKGRFVKKEDEVLMRDLMSLT